MPIKIDLDSEKPREFNSLSPVHSCPTTAPPEAPQESLPDASNSSPSSQTPPSARGAAPCSPTPSSPSPQHSPLLTSLAPSPHTSRAEGPGWAQPPGPARISRARGSSRLSPGQRRPARPRWSGDLGQSRRSPRVLTGAAAICLQPKAPSPRPSQPRTRTHPSAADTALPSSTRVPGDDSNEVVNAPLASPPPPYVFASAEQQKCFLAAVFNRGQGGR